MKKLEQMAAAYVLSEVDPSDYVERAQDQLAQQIFIAGFKAAREMAIAEAEKERGVISGAVAGRIQQAIRQLGEEEVDSSPKTNEPIP